jgi:hypothetical protein
MNSELMLKYEDIRVGVEQRKGQRELLRKSLNEEREKAVNLQVRADNALKARVIIQDVAQQTQKNLEYHISHLVSTALASVFPNPPQFVTEFVLRRNKTECDMYFKEFDVLEKPLDSSGGGPLDVASNALRYSYWSLKRNRPTFILDEPFKFVSPDLHHKVSDMLKMLSEKLGIQIIMVSHSEEVNISADKTFVVTKEDQLSKVKVI